MGAMVVASIALTGLVVALIAAIRGYMRAREAERQVTRILGDENSHSLFGGDVPVRQIERRFVEAMPDAVVVTDVNGVVRYASPGAKTLKIMEGNTIPTREILDILSLVAGDGVVRVREVSVRLHGLPGAFEGGSGRGVQAGEEPPSNTLHLRVRVGVIAEGLYAMFLADMSEQRRFEAMRRDFVTNVSHELKTPAGAISLLAETISDASDDPKAVRYFSSRISMESARLTELVHHLIDLQRAQSTNAIIGAKRLSVLGMVRDAVSENAIQAEAKHIEIRVSLAGMPVAQTMEEAADDGETKDAYVMADREAITTSIKNLVENAIRYSPENTTVGVGVVQRDDKVMIRVVDQGIGIPADSLGRIFERFYRVDPARSRATGGSGLGLAITKHCVQECGGKISVWSREGEGSTFTIELPGANDTDGDDAARAERDPRPAEATTYGEEATAVGGAPARDGERHGHESACGEPVGDMPAHGIED